MIKQVTLVLALLIAGTLDAQARVYETTFRLEYPAARAVYVVGSFNNWETGPSCLMKRHGRVWSRTLNLEEGVYPYKFRVMGETDLPDAGWMQDPGNPLMIQYGTQNSLRVVPAGRNAAQVLNRARQDVDAFSRSLRELIAAGETVTAHVLSDSVSKTLGPSTKQFFERLKALTQARIDAEKLSPHLSQRAARSGRDANARIERMDGALNYFLATDALDSAREGVVYGASEMGPYFDWLEDNARKARQASVTGQPAVPAAVPEVSKMNGQEPPAFDSTSLSGQRVSLAELKGHVVLIDFWATWCGPCIYEMPHVKELYTEFEPSGLRIIGVSLDKDEAALRTYVHENGIAWPQLFDGKGWQSVLAAAYGVRSIPATFLLDRNGRVAAVNLRGNALKQKVAELLR